MPSRDRIAAEPAAKQIRESGKLVSGWESGLPLPLPERCTAVWTGETVAAKGGSWVAPEPVRARSSEDRAAAF